MLHRQIDTIFPPQIDILANSKRSPYLLLMIDPDYNKTVPANVVLHTMVGNLTASPHPFNASNQTTEPSKISPAFNASFVPLHTISPALAPYIHPLPQPGQPTHNYTLLLFRQPFDFSVPAVFQSFLPLNLSNVYTRTNFPLLDFVRETGLRQPIASSWFRLILGGDATSTASETTTPAGWRFRENEISHGSLHTSSFV